MKKLLVALLLACSCAGAEVTDAEGMQISGVIGQMFVALQRNDAETLFALQTEDTRHMYKSAGEFAAELKRCCMALHEAVNEVVMNITGAGPKVTAFVLMIDGDGDRWSAQFILEKHATWQIDEIHINLLDPDGVTEMGL